MYVEPLAECLIYSQLSQMLGAIIILEELLHISLFALLFYPPGRQAELRDHLWQTQRLFQSGEWCDYSNQEKQQL